MNPEVCLYIAGLPREDLQLAYMDLYRLCVRNRVENIHVVRDMLTKPSFRDTLLNTLANDIADLPPVGFCNGPLGEVEGLSESQIARLNGQCLECQE